MNIWSPPEKIRVRVRLLNGGERRLELGLSFLVNPFSVRNWDYPDGNSCARTEVITIEDDEIISIDDDDVISIEDEDDHVIKINDEIISVGDDEVRVETLFFVKILIKEISIFDQFSTVGQNL